MGCDAENIKSVSLIYCKIGGFAKGKALAVE